MEFICEEISGGIPEDFETGYLALSAKYADDGESLDKDFYEYVCDSILAEHEIHTAIVSEVVRSFYPDYAIDEEDVASFARAARGLRARRLPAPLPPRPEQEPPEAELPQLPDAPEAVKEEKEIWSEQNVEDISYICSIFPNIDISIIEYVYMSKCAKNKDPTVEFLLENCSDDAGIERMANKMAEKREKERRDAERAAEEARKMQAVLFQKYGDRAVVQTGGGKSNKKEEKVHLVLENPVSGAGGKGKTSKIRYRDGQIATHTGEKVQYCAFFNASSFALSCALLFCLQVIVIKNPADDYDGGSRGKVKSKGKRGPGFY